MKLKNFTSFMLTIVLLISFTSAYSMNYIEFMTYAIKKQDEFNDQDKQQAALHSKKNVLLFKTLVYGAGSATALGLLTFSPTDRASDGGSIWIALSPIIAYISAYCTYKCLSYGVQRYELTSQNVFNDEKLELIKQIKQYKYISLDKEIDLRLTTVLKHKH